MKIVALFRSYPQAIAIIKRIRKEVSPNLTHLCARGYVLPMRLFQTPDIRRWNRFFRRDELKENSGWTMWALVHLPPPPPAPAVPPGRIATKPEVAPDLSGECSPCLRWFLLLYPPLVNGPVIASTQIITQADNEKKKHIMRNYWNKMRNAVIKTSLEE